MVSLVTTATRAQKMTIARAGPALVGQRPVVTMAMPARRTTVTGLGDAITFRPRTAQLVRMEILAQQETAVGQAPANPHQDLIATTTRLARTTRAISRSVASMTR
jgi:hypothetical protein